MLKIATDEIRHTSTIRRGGRLRRINGLILEAEGLRLPLGATCCIELADHLVAEAEVVGFKDDLLFLMPTEELYGVSPGAPVFPSDPSPLPLVPGALHPERRRTDRAKHLPVGEGLLGRVVDANGRPLDGRGPLVHVLPRSLASRPLNPMARTPIEEPLDVGIRAINGLLTVGNGQRLGLFAGTGVGKSVLLGMMARNTTADVIVVGLIGERGREVREFVDEILERDGLERSVVVAAPADANPLLRLQGAIYATAIAEHFRETGKAVLLIMDSLTRFAMAQREIALSIGEPPVTKGYPASVFARLPALVERAGRGRAGEGSITAFYTVLTEGDDLQDPVADAARGILDGHIVLSRALAEAGHYPAIDVERSISRVMPAVVAPEHLQLAIRFKRLWARYQSARDLIAVGAYQKGADPELDEAIARQPIMARYLQQGMRERAPFAEALTQLAQVLQ
ncbi:MAG: flagellar protein export ATPase FliI [Hydrogenophilus sp.]|nr:flagellar protein export ATPase FliI [Hydrogenophilus sp.]